MDIERIGVARSRRIRRISYGAAALGAIVLITLGLSRLEPAAPSVEHSTVWVDTVQGGSYGRCSGAAAEQPERAALLLRQMPAWPNQLERH